MGMRIYSDVAFDDFSMSPECFGLNMPADELRSYNYYDQRNLHDKTPHDDFVNHTSEWPISVFQVNSKIVRLSINQFFCFYPGVWLSTCNASGRLGPSPSDCIDTYNNSDSMDAVKMVDDPKWKGVQLWRVPSENYYT